MQFHRNKPRTCHCLNVADDLVLVLLRGTEAVSKFGGTEEVAAVGDS